jgi:hypothetical protein
VTGRGSTEVDVEEIRGVQQVTWERAVEMILNGEINEMQAVAAILLAREAVRSTP